MTKYPLFLVISSIILSGCVGLERELTNTPLDLRKNKKSVPAVLVRESAPMFSDMELSDNNNSIAQQNRYARTDANYVILDDYTNSERKNAVWNGKSFMKHDPIKVSQSYDRVYLPAGSHRIQYSCFASFQVDLENPRKKLEGDVLASFKSSKCYQLKTSSTIKYFGLEQHDRYGRVNRILSKNDPNWFKQCANETSVEEIPCESIKQSF